MTEIKKSSMAVLCILAGEGFTKEMYEELKKEVDWEHNQPTGEVFHSIGFDNSGGYHVVDIWESEQDFNNFINNKIKPAMDKINAPMPKGEIIQLHSANAFQGIDSYRVK
jgi:hypothetical protein